MRGCADLEENNVEKVLEIQDRWNQPTKYVPLPAKDHETIDLLHVHALFNVAMDLEFQRVRLAEDRSVKVKVKFSKKKSRRRAAAPAPAAGGQKKDAVLVDPADEDEPEGIERFKEKAFATLWTEMKGFAPQGVKEEIVHSSWEHYSLLLQTADFQVTSRMHLCVLTAREH